MSTIKIEYDGFVFEVRSAEEAAALHRLLRNGRAPIKRKKAIRREKAVSKTPEEERQKVDQALRALKMVREAPVNGVSTKDIMQALGLEQPLQLGHVTNRIKGLATRTHIEPDSIYQRVPREGRTYWVAGENIDRAIEEFEALLGDKGSLL